MDDFEDFFAIPAIWVPGMPEEIWDVELNNVVRRAFLTRDFVENRISPEDYMDGLSDYGVPVYEAEEYWQNGICLR